MTNRSSLLSNPILLGVGGLVVGLLIGWFLLGWVLFPVQYTNADLWDLNPPAKEMYIVTVADAYAADQNVTLSQERLRGLTAEEISQSLTSEFAKRNTKGDAAGAARISSFAQALGMPLSSSPTQPQPTPTPGKQGGGLTDNLGMLLLILAGVILLVAGALFLYMRMKNRQAAPPAASSAQTSAEPAGLSDAPGSAPAMAVAPAAAAGAATAARPGATPLAKSLGTFAATYKFGEDNYDTSFTLETTRGEFLGETGMGSSETVGEGKPDKVTAFDVWLFDKTDVRTVTQILMSEAAYNNQATRQRLATKGELVLAEKGKTVRLETATLVVDCEIVDLVYASTPGLPPNSHFQKLIVEMVPSQK
ncbi:MAG: hypothetical protein DCC52_06185 [Chloroflexi bacterium]|nr:MAG: hypothetical protein DCC52_06185 [Chloroflexota bacterium]